MNIKEIVKLPLGCLLVLLIAVIVWIAIQFVSIPAAERHVNRHGHTLKDYTDRLFHGR